MSASVLHRRAPRAQQDPQRSVTQHSCSRTVRANVSRTQIHNTLLECVLRGRVGDSGFGSGDDGASGPVCDSGVLADARNSLAGGVVTALSNGRFKRSCDRSARTTRAAGARRRTTCARFVTLTARAFARSVGMDYRARLGSARQGVAWHGRARQGNSRSADTSCAGVPSIKARSGSASLCDARQGHPSLTETCGADFAAMHVVVPLGKASRGNARHGWLRQGHSPLAETCAVGFEVSRGTAWQGLAGQGLDKVVARRGHAARGVVASRCKARSGTDVLGNAGRGEAWSSVRAGTHAPAFLRLGSACLAMARHGKVRPGPARFTDARGDVRVGILGARRVAARLGLARRRTSRFVRLCGNAVAGILAWRGTSLLGVSGRCLACHGKVRPSARERGGGLSRGGARFCLVWHGWARPGVSRQGSPTFAETRTRGFWFGGARLAPASLGASGSGKARFADSRLAT